MRKTNFLITIVLVSSHLFAQTDTVKLAQTDTVRLVIEPSQEAEKSYNNGINLLQSKTYDDAIAAFTKAISIKPEMEKAYYNRGLAFSELNKTNEATDCWGE